jgi:hypothetical protein
MSEAGGKAREHGAVAKAGAVSAMLVLVITECLIRKLLPCTLLAPAQLAAVPLVPQSHTATISTGCSGASVAGRRFLRVGFIDEQLNSGSHSVLELIKFAQGTGRTLVEPFAGGFPRVSAFHAGCPQPAGTFEYTRMSALYDVGGHVANGTIVLLDEFWQLQRCGLVPEVPELMPSSYKAGECLTCNAGARHPTGHVMDLACSKAGAGASNAPQWEAMARGPEPYIEACCVRKNDRKPQNAHFSWPYLKPSEVPGLGPLLFDFNLPRKMAAEWVERKAFAKNGFIAVHWRSEKCKKKWKDRAQGTNLRMFLSAIDRAIAKACQHRAPAGGKRAPPCMKIVFMGDFLEGASATMSGEWGKAYNSSVHEERFGLLNALDEAYGGLMRLDPASPDSFPEAFAQGGHMMIAAASMEIAAAATELVVLCDAGLFVNSVKRMRKARGLTPATVPLPVGN